MNFRAVLYALLSAILFGMSTPAAKGLLTSMHPIVLAGLLYCGAGVGIALVRIIRWNTLTGPTEARLQRTDIPWLTGAIVVGGIIGPVLLLVGLSRTSASTSSLLLTFEGLATALMAWLIFHENLDRRIALGMLFLVVGALTVGWSGSPTFDGLLGPMAIVGACAAWGLDNNLTRKVSLADPLQIVAAKGLVAGPVTVLLGFLAGGEMPDLLATMSALAIGFLCYGLSLVLYVLALRDLGTARTAAYFSVAPFIGAVVSVIAFSEPMSVQFIIGGLLLAMGVWLHVTERHEHEHMHEPQSHSHAHVHDENHSHSHLATDPAGEPHTHLHVHKRIKHSHQHTPDMHHQHRH